MAVSSATSEGALFEGGGFKTFPKTDMVEAGLLCLSILSGSDGKGWTLFSFKSLDLDRLILNPILRNGRCRRVNRYARTMGHGFLLVFLHIRR